MDMGIYQKISTNPAIALGVSETTLVGSNECICNFFKRWNESFTIWFGKLSLETGVVFRIEVYHQTPTVF